MKNIWLITDTHLGHANMVKYCGRPENHSEIILQNLKEMIKEGDTLIHLGDICFGSDAAWHLELEGCLPKNVNRILVRGNHDRKSDKWYIEHGWWYVCDSFSDIFFDHFITFSHRPIQGTQNINIHGHMHNSKHLPEERYNPKLHKLLAIEYTDYKPVLLESFLSK